MKQWLLIAMTLIISCTAQSAERVVTLGGDVTEIVFELNAGDQVVARDSTSLHPAEAVKLPDVGYMRMLNAEGVLSMRPTVILASELAKPSIALSQIEKSGVKIIKVTGKPSLEAVPEKITTIANAVGKVEQGKQLTEKFNQQLAKVNTSPIDKKVLFIMSHGGVLPLAAGQQTAADSLIKATGAKNAMSGFNSYRPLSQEGVIASQPDLIIVTQEGIKSLGGKERVWKLPGVAMTPAAKNKALIVVDDMGMLGFSLGTPEVMLQIREALENSQ
ncbi:hemin ABC transporter substrate-binding protein [Providencia stuartii]|uniref:Hemin ABC transporter substrate-binding protein n=1 Tax=Providencia manganoxydans TaxID=2923283 RepID=A0ABX7ABF0_9GAMM|nr:MULTISPECIES: hemin ABC transporter substrate-binding protein [Providencia]ELR5298940.1 hemin ABC transporter substrate-binding protein [Providencia stuartii]MDW7587603.1 hemin ABC transporter substrate-binding protein [Providencia sp. 2023EL-00965]MDX4944050.1 hemin ABC transporter substrate-binding protein [Providencia manganoxydans]QQO60987.1 hemin ABC transporter substrate-binding protein [Providencia manganoxydans]HEF8772334.1 hemin ABC transporter substrate-binding protein [Providenci